MKRIKVTKEEYDNFMKENKITHAHVIRFCDPPIKFYWTELHEDMSFGKHSVASRVLNSLSPYKDSIVEDEYYIHDYSDETGSNP